MMIKGYIDICPYRKTTSSQYCSGKLNVIPVYPKEDNILEEEEEVQEMAEKFIKEAIKKKGALRKTLGIKGKKKIPSKTITTKISTLEKQAEGEKKLSPSQRLMLRRLTLARTLNKLRNK